MNSELTPERLREALRRTGNEWFLGREGVEVFLVQWCEGLRAFAAAYRGRFGETPDPFRLLDSDAPKARAFFQLDTLRLSAEMKVAVWRIFVGCTIQKLEVSFTSGARSSLRLELAPPGQEPEPYTSDDPNDVRLLRHLGTITVNGRLELQGYYAFAS